MSEMQTMKLAPTVGVAPKMPQARIWYNRDLTVMFDELGNYEAFAHGYRLRFRVIERDGARGKYFLVIPLFLDTLCRQEGRTVPDENIYNRRLDKVGLNIPLERLRGRGPLPPNSRRYGEIERELLTLMERVIHAGMADSVVKYVDYVPESVATH